MNELKTEIKTVWRAITAFLLQISQQKFGQKQTGGYLMMGKVLCVQHYYLNAFDFLREAYADDKEPPQHILQQFLEKLKTVLYFVERPTENFDDFLERFKVRDEDGKLHSFKAVDCITAYDFEYLRNFKIDEI